MWREEGVVTNGLSEGAASSCIMVAVVWCCGGEMTVVTSTMRTSATAWPYVAMVKFRVEARTLG